jgi:hypothetical protein
MKVYHCHIESDDWHGFNTVHATEESAELLQRACIIYRMTEGSADPRRAELEALSLDELQAVYEEEESETGNFSEEVEVLDLKSLEEAYKAV